MIRFSAVIKRFGSQGEKTGWTYIEVPQELAVQLQPNSRKSFRVKGKLDSYAFSMLALLPMKASGYIMTLNAATRKGIKKSAGATVQVQMDLDKGTIQPPPELVECLADEPEAKAYYESLPQGHRNYFSNWIRSAKTEETKARRIAAAINAFVHKWDYGQMIREMKKGEW